MTITIACTNKSITRIYPHAFNISDIKALITRVQTEFFFQYGSVCIFILYMGLITLYKSRTPALLLRLDVDAAATYWNTIT